LESPELLVEQFRHGREFSVETISESGEHLVLGVTSTCHLRREADHYIEIAHGVPAPVTPADRERIAARVASALDAVGVQTGVTHTEVIVDADDVHILETHIRPGGDQIPDLWALVSGVDLVDETVRQNLGEWVLADVRARLGGTDRPPYAAIWYACPTAVGEITHVDGVDAARAVRGVVKVEIVLGPGEQLVPVVNTACRAAYVCAVGDSHEEALDRARQGVACLSFVVRTQDAGLDGGNE
jgi:biotin carboxylase